MRGTRSRHTSLASQRTTTSHSTPTRSISEAHAQDAHHWHHSTRQPAIPHVHARVQKHPLTVEMYLSHEDLRKTSRSPCRRSFSEAPAQHKQQKNHSTSKPTIPQLHARFPKHPLKTHIIGITAHDNQPFPMYTLDFRSTHSR